MGLCNILAMKLAYREEMTLCYKFGPSDDLFSGLLKSLKKEYSSEWSGIVLKEDVRRLDSCEMWLWRKVLNNSLSDKVCNEEVLRSVSEERATVSVINRRRGVWLFKGLSILLFLPVAFPF